MHTQAIVWLVERGSFNYNFACGELESLLGFSLQYFPSTGLEVLYRISRPLSYARRLISALTPPV